ncbi:MAG: hypothetical protein V1740_02930 [Candidatus Woesearchaeota archaeon]
MYITFNGKPILPTKDALNELSEIDMDLYDVSEILENGFELRKRKKNILEKAIARGNKVINVVVVDVGNYYKLIHCGEFTLTYKFRGILKDKNGF